MTELDVYRPQGELALVAQTAMERAADFTTWTPKLQGAAAIAREICQTDFVPAALRGKPAAVAAAIMAGAEMNLGPMASLMHIHVIEGRPALSSEMQRALVLSLGHHIRYREMTITRCIIDGRRRGEDEWTTVEWTMDDAKRAGLEGRQNWRRYPRRMLAARATGELCRMLFADALAGMPYSADELEDEADDTAASTSGAPAADAKQPRTAQRAARKTSPPAQPASTHAATTQAAGEPQGDAGGALPPLPGEEWDGSGTPPPPLPGAGESPLPDDRDYDTPGTVATPQITAIWTVLSVHYQFGRDEKDQARMVCAQIIGRDLESTKNLSRNEAKSILDTLGHWRSQAEAKGEDTRAYLIQMLAAAEEARHGDE